MLSYLATPLALQTEHSAWQNLRELYGRDLDATVRNLLDADIDGFVPDLH